MKKLIMLMCILALVACNKKEEDDSVIEGGDVLTPPADVLLMSELVGSGTSACLNANVGLIGSYANGHYYKYNFNVLDATGDFRFGTTVYSDAGCTNDVYSVSQVGTLAIVGGSTLIAGATNVAITISMTTLGVDDATWYGYLDGGVCTRLHTLGNVTDVDNNSCSFGAFFNSVAWPAVGAVYKNSFTLVDHGGWKTLHMNKTDTTHFDMYSVGKTSAYPSSNGVEFSFY